MQSKLFIRFLRIFAFALPCLSTLANAETGIPAFTVNTLDSGEQSWSLSLQALVLMTGLTLLPAFLLLMTSFTRIVIVLGILRTALGTAQTPSNQILIGLALFLTLFIMSPVFNVIYQDAYLPYQEGNQTAQSSLEEALVPLKEFMINQTRSSDLTMFVNMSGSDDYDVKENIPLTILLPAFVTSELKTAFQIGFMLFIPFLIIDLVVASVLMSMGMMMLSPLIISLPFKLMLFVLVDGWSLVLGTLAGSFY